MTLLQAARHREMKPVLVDFEDSYLQLNTRQTKERKFDFGTDTHAAGLIEGQAVEASWDDIIILN